MNVRKLLFASALAVLPAVLLAGGAAPAHATHCDSCVTVVDTCCAKIPQIQDPVFQPPARAVIETREPSPGIWDFSVTLYDITQNIPAENVNWNPITRYHGPGGNWNRANLGSVFGLTIDKHGNIFVTHTSCYSGDYLGTGGAGAIYRLDGTTGAISVFATLPNVADPNLPAGSNLPGLGNITYDCDNDQFFVTNMEDGRIYRLKSFNASNGSPATVLDFFDPGTPDDGLPGFAPLTERLWAVEWHAGRVYYSVWAEDFSQPLNNPAVNGIRSVGLDGSGGFVWWSDRHELLLPAYPSLPGLSAPVSDISFGPTGKMLLAERSMIGPTSPNAHRSRVLEYLCEGTSWLPTNSFAVGQISNQTNAAGGVDYDYWPYNGPSPPATAPPGLGGSQGRIWATADAIHFFSPYSDIIYGLQGFRPTGGSILNSLLIDSDGDVANQDKTNIGDVEVPCPPAQPPHDNEIHGHKFLDFDHDGIKDPSEPYVPGWTINLSGPVNATTVTDANGEYWFMGLPAGTYTVSEIGQPGHIITAPPGGSFSVTVPPTAVNVDFGNYRCPDDKCVKGPGGMVAWWPLDEPAGTVAHDIKGPNNGGWVGSPTVILGQRVGNSLRLTGSGDYVAAPNHASLNFGTGDFSIDAWVRTTSTDASVRTIVDHRTGAASGPVGYSFFMFNTRLGFQLGDGSATLNHLAPGSSPTLADGQWHHVAVTVKRNSTTGGRLYVDGVIVHTFDPTTRPGSTTNTGPLWIGQRQISSPVAFAGDIDEVELFCRELDSLQVRSIFQAGADGKCKKSCYLPKIRTFGPSQTNISVCFNIINNDWTQPSMSFTWSLAGLPSNPPTCTIAGPTTFTPASGTVTVPAGGSVPVCVTIDRPAGLVPGQTACYQLTVMNDMTGTCFKCVGKLRASNQFHGVAEPADAVGIPDDGSAPVAFTLVNEGAAASFDFEVVAVSADEDDANRAISLNGLPPGEPVIGTRSAGANETFHVVVNVQYLLKIIKFPFQDLVLRWDLDGDGVADDASAIGVRPDFSARVSAPDDPQSGRLDRAIGYPNPFERGTAVRFALPRAEDVTVRVFDVNGRLVRTLHTGRMRAGTHVVRWDGADASGVRAGNGMYFVRVQAGDRTLDTKVVRVK